MKKLKRKGTMVLTSFLIVGLVCSNAYALVQNKNDKEQLETLKTELKIANSQILQSSEYASHEDMITAFNQYSAENKISYEGSDYYLDLKTVESHHFKEKEKDKYSADVVISYLKDKKDNGNSYIQTTLPSKVINNFQEVLAKKEAEKQKNDNFNFSTPMTIEKSELIKIEKEIKESLEVGTHDMELSFNMKNQNEMILDNAIKDKLLSSFIQTIVMKDKDAKITTKEDKDYKYFYVEQGSKNYQYSYNKKSKELKKA